MSGYELRRKPGMTSIHAAYANKTIRKSGPEEEFEVITPELIAELEDKIKRLIRNVELFPAYNVESTLKKAREVEEKITEIIKTMFSQIKKEAVSSITPNGSKEFNPKLKGLTAKDVDTLLIQLGEVEDALKKYANRVIKMKAFRALSHMCNKDKKSLNTNKYVVKCTKANRASKNDEKVVKGCQSKDVAQPKEVKPNKIEKTEKKKGNKQYASK